MILAIMFQHTAARRRLAATATPTSMPNCCFNTQPREGGWRRCVRSEHLLKHGFNTQPREGGWPSNPNNSQAITPFQHTAARRRLGPDKARDML